jgi:hypothetical protein
VTNAFAIHLSWDTPEAAGTAADATWGSLAILVDGHSVWGGVAESPSGFHWTWVEILEFLAEIWPWLLWEEGWPLGLSPRDPTEFEIRAKRLIESLPPTKKDEGISELFEFRQRHDLASALQGAIVPGLWIVREGAKAWVASKSIAVRVPASDVMERLSDLGDAIATRLAGLEDVRAKDAVADWAARSDVDTAEAISISTHLSSQELISLAGDDIATGFEVDDAALNVRAATELMAVARLAAPAADTEVLKRVLAVIKGIPVTSSLLLANLAEEAQDFLASSQFDSPATEGYELGRWFRAKHGLSEWNRAEPDEFLKLWGVQTTVHDLGTSAVDAIACWGPRHGPAIVLNVGSRHPRNSSLAHEIAHLLVDRTDALPLAEVLGAPAPRLAESRANAFLAELLIPRTIAGQEMGAATDGAATLARLASHFGVGHEVIAWQAYNSGWKLSWPTFNMLRGKVSRPDHFLWRKVA